MQAYNGYDLKHYAVSNYSGLDNYLMAGTVFGYNGANGSNAIHYLKVDNAGSTVFSKLYHHTPNPSYPNTDWNDERVVGAHTQSNQDFVIVANISSDTNTVLDCFEILLFDSNGNIKPESKIAIANNSLPVSPFYRNWYATKSLLVGNDILYVCGYVTEDFKPDLSSAKMGFVARYDLNAFAPSSTATASTIVYFDAPNTNNPTYDFDMAKALKMVGAGLWVGGTTNGGPALNVILDPVTLAVVPNENKPMGRLYASQGIITESSFDIAEDPNTNGYFVFTNSTGLRVDVSGRHYEHPQWFNIIAVQPDLAPVPGASRLVYPLLDEIWGVNLVPGNNLSPDAEVILSGYQSWSNCNTPPPRSPISITNGKDNIRPFLFSMALSTNPSGIAVNQYYFNTLLSQTGTGPVSQPNSYYNLGGIKSSLLSSPVTTVRDLTSTTDIFMSSPAYWYRYNKLAVKWIRTDKYGQLSGCAWEPFCNANPIQDTAVLTTGPTAFTTQGNYIIDLQNYALNNFTPDRIFDCGTLYKPAPTTVTTIATYGNLSVKLYPNPAADVFSLQLKGDFDRAVTVDIKLVDITGRVVEDLYNGVAANIPTEFHKGSIQSGVYMINFIYNGRKIKSLPLTIK